MTIAQDPNTNQATAKSPAAAPEATTALRSPKPEQAA